MQDPHPRNRSLLLDPRHSTLRPAPHLHVLRAKCNGLQHRRRLLQELRRTNGHPRTSSLAYLASNGRRQRRSDQAMLPRRAAPETRQVDADDQAGVPGGAFINGFVVHHLGVAWIYWIFAIINGVQFIAYLLLGQETLYIKDSPDNSKHRTVLSRLLPHRIDPRPFQAQNFIEPLLLARFPRIRIPGIGYGIEFAYANITILVETPLIFGETFHFNAQQVGYQFLSVIIGSVIGEQLSGPHVRLVSENSSSQKGTYYPR